MKIKRRKTSPVSSGAMADVAFLLLIFFMVATTLQRDKTIPMKLPPLADNPRPQQVAENKVLTISINGSNEVMIENHISNSKIDQTIHQHLLKMINQNIKPIINVKMHPDSSYESYLGMLSHIKKAIRRTKEVLSQSLFNTTLDQISREEYLLLNRKCGIKIMEAEV